MAQKELKQAGLMITTPRLRVLSLLESKKAKHWTVDELYRELVSEDESISLGTVYRVLMQFENADLVVRRQFEKGSAYYELNRKDNHNHIVCIKCGKISEFYDPTIEKRLKTIVSKNKYKLTDHSLVLYAICSKCSG